MRTFIRSVPIALLIIICSFCISFADDSTDPLDCLEYSVNADGVSCTITGTRLSSWRDPVIPAEIDGYAVTAISPYCFTGVRLRGTLTLPDGLESIGEASFSAYYDVTDSDPKGLTGDLIIPDSVNEIGISAFSNNPFGGRLHLPASLTQINNYTFFKCSFSEDIIIPPLVKTIGTYALTSGDAQKTLLQSGAKLILNDNLRAIGASAFYCCGDMGRVVFPNTLISIGDNAFQGCTIESAVLPPNVEMVGQSALSSCLETYILNDEIEAADAYSFGIPGVTRIHANSGSAAERYAEANGSEFISFDSASSHATAPCEEEHMWGEEYVLKEPTYTETGRAVAICTICGEVNVQTLDCLKPEDETPHETKDQMITVFALSYSKTTNSKEFNLKASAETPLTYMSSNTKVAAVDSAGNVKITGPGKAVITISAEASDDYYAAERQVAISASLAKPGLTVKNLKGRKAKITWTKSNYADGYRIYVKGPGEKKYRLRLTKSAKVKSVTHKGLRKGKTYRYKVVAFKKVNGKIVTSKASAIKKVKIKK